MAMRSSFLSSLLPVSYVRNYVQEIYTNYFSKTNHLLIGIHYRAHEDNFDWKVVPPGPNDNEAYEFGKVANEEQFANIMRILDKKYTIVDKHGLEKKKYKFYIGLFYYHYQHNKIIIIIIIIIIQLLILPMLKIIFIIFSPKVFLLTKL